MAGKAISMTDELAAYLVAHSDPPRTDVHDRLIAHTAEVMGDLSTMQVSPEQGPWLTFMARLVGAKQAVEVGTFTGYSALCTAEGLGEGGRLRCFDVSAEWVDIGRPYWREAGVADRIEVTIGPAAENLATLPATEEIDFAFIDADKTGYAGYYEQLLPRMRRGGLIVADNTLWSGRVLDDVTDDEDTLAIRSYNDMVTADDRVDALLVNVGDGLMLARKC
jgi:caffeoyl-CoA O-methyltransferase